MTLVLLCSMAIVMAGGLMLSGTGLVLIAVGDLRSTVRGPSRVV